MAHRFVFYTVHNASVCTNKMYRICAVCTCTFFWVPVRGQQIPRGLRPEMSIKKLGPLYQIEPTPPRSNKCQPHEISELSQVNHWTTVTHQNTAHARRNASTLCIVAECPLFPKSVEKMNALSVISATRPNPEAVGPKTDQ